MLGKASIAAVSALVSLTLVAMGIMTTVILTSKLSYSGELVTILVFIIILHIISGDSFHLKPIEDHYGM